MNDLKKRRDVKEIQQASCLEVWGNEEESSTPWSPFMPPHHSCIARHLISLIIFNCYLVEKKLIFYVPQDFFFFLKLQRTGPWPQWFLKTDAGYKALTHGSFSKEVVHYVALCRWFAAYCRHLEANRGVTTGIIHETEPSKRTALLLDKQNKYV